MKDTPPGLTTVSQVSIEANIDRRTLNRRISQAGLLPTLHKGRSIYYNRAALMSLATAGHAARAETQELQRMILAERHRELRRRNDEADAGLVQAAVADREIQAQADAFAVEADAFPGRVAHQLVNRSPWQIELILRRELDGLRNRLGNVLR